MNYGDDDGSALDACDPTPHRCFRCDTQPVVFPSEFCDACRRKREEDRHLFVCSGCGWILIAAAITALLLLVWKGG